MNVVKNNEQIRNLALFIRNDLARLPEKDVCGVENDPSELLQYYHDLLRIIETGEVKVTDEKGELALWLQGESDILDVYFEP